MQALVWEPGDEIRKARKLAKMKQEDLAREVGVSRPQVSKWERGKAIPDILQWRAIGRATGVQLSVYMSRKGGKLGLGAGDLRKRGETAA